MADTEQVSIDLPAEQMAPLHQAIASGEYNTTGDILREALDEWQQRRELSPAELSRLQQMWAEGKESGQPVAVDVQRLFQTTRERLSRRT